MNEKTLIENSAKLNDQQLEMLRLFKTPMPAHYFEEVRNTVIKILASNIDVEMGKLETEKSWNADTYKKWGSEHGRTPYKP